MKFILMRNGSNLLGSSDSVRHSKGVAKMTAGKDSTLFANSQQSETQHKKGISKIDVKFKVDKK